MAKICQVSGKTNNTTAKHIRNQHSQGWKYKAPHKNRVQNVNLQRITLRTPDGRSYQLRVATSVIKSPEFNMVACGLKPVPQAWLRKATYEG